MNQRICNQVDHHDHDHTNMKKTAVVVAITITTMVAEITYGLITGSMALLADGIHMGTHTFALVVTLIAYRVAAKNAHNPNFAFSSGKVGILGGYTNAIILGITAFYMVYEAIHRLIAPQEIHFNQALWVAVIGLSVNIVSALLLSSGGHDHEHPHGHDHHHDHNLRSAYIHVITDAFTSVLAIIALLTGKFFNQTWPDAVVAILGALVILKWSYDLAVSSGRLLVDHHPLEQDQKAIHSIVDQTGSSVEDLHIWKTSEKDKAAILTIKPGGTFEKSACRERLQVECHIDHLTIELI